MATYKKLIHSGSSNEVTANLLNVSGDGSAGQFLASDGDGSMTWTTQTAPNDSTVSISGTGISNGSFTTNQSSNSTVTLNLAMNELTTGNADIVGNEDFLIYLDEDNDKKILFEDVKLTAFDNDLVSAPGNFNITGDLTVTGNDIKSPTGTAITLAATNVAVGGHLTVTGNEIKSSSATAITLSGADVTIAGDLTVTGKTITTTSETLEIADNTIHLNSDLGSGTAGVDAGIVVERGSDGDNACLFWDRSKTAWAIGTSSNAALPSTSSLLMVNVENAGVPTSTETGVGGMVYDTTSNEMYIRTA